MNTDLLSLGVLLVGLIAAGFVIGFDRGKAKGWNDCREMLRTDETDEAGA